MRRFFSLSWPERLLLIEALMWLSFARLAVLLLPFRRVSRWLGTPMTESPSDGEPPRAIRVGRIAWAVGAVSRRLPWRSKCLEQAIAGKMMLRRRGVPNTLYLGVARGSAGRGGSVEAHAWLRCGSIVLTGGEDRGRFAVVSMFADGAATRSEPPAS